MLALAAGCSGDPTTSDEYAELEQELAVVTAERDSLEAQVASATDPPDETAIPPGVDELIDDWWNALAQGDDSVLDLYLPSGYHMYGGQRVSREDLVSHLAGSGYLSEWTTPTFVATNEGDETYVVVRGVRNTHIATGTSWASAFAFEIETVASGDLRIAHTAFIYRRD